MAIKFETKIVLPSNNVQLIEIFEFVGLVQLLEQNLSKLSTKPRHIISRWISIVKFRGQMIGKRVLRTMIGAGTLSKRNTIVPRLLAAGRWLGEKKQWFLFVMSTTRWTPFVHIMMILFHFYWDRVDCSCNPRMRPIVSSVRENVPKTINRAYLNAARVYFH